MADDDNNPQTPAQSHPRRSSFAGQTFAGLFGNGRAREPQGSFSENDSNGTHPGPITSAAVNARSRGMSLTTLGLSSSPETNARFGAFRNQRDSLASSPSSIDESAIEDEVGPRDMAPAGSSFQRRASFGARAFMDMRNSSNGANGGAGQNGTKSPPAASFSRAPNGTVSSRDVQGRGEGFNWSENFRTRAERTSIAASTVADRPNFVHSRARSVAVMEPPVPEMPKSSSRPDHFQERILKGDFYMD